MTSSIRILATAFLSGVFTIGLADAQETTSEHEVDNDPGLVELDRATELRLTADSMADLQRIVRLCESAIKLGIDEENTEYAVELMTAALYEHAPRLSQPLLAKQGRDRQRQALLTLALKDLHRLMEIDDTLAPDVVTQLKFNRFNHAFSSNILTIIPDPRPYSSRKRHTRD